MDVSWRILLSVLVMICSPDVTVTKLLLEPQAPEHAFFTNESFFVRCSGSNENSALLTWTGPNGMDITSREGRIHVEDASDKQPGLRLVVEEVRQKDSGKYTCTGGNDESVAFNLIVYKSISFRDTPQNQHAPEGENITVQCRAKSDRNLIVSWSFNGSKLSTGDKYNISEKGLTVYNVTKEDAGNYTCDAFLVTSHRSQFKEMNIKVHVQFSPEWKEPHENRRYSNIGAVTNLTCSAVSEPSPKFEWDKEGEPLFNDSNYVIWNYPDSSVLQVRVHNESMFGEYACRVSNHLGTKERIIDLERGVTPQAPKVSVTSEEPGVFVLDIEPLKGEPMKVTGFRVEYRLKSESWDVAKWQHFELNDRYILRDMNYDTNYILRVSAKNAAGYGAFSDEINHEMKSPNSAKVTDNSAICRQSSAIGALLSTVASLWLLKL